MQINVIHLPNRIDRLALLKKEFQQESITDFKIWDGIIDGSLSKNRISKAHKQIVQYAKSKNLPEILIAEDDLHFTSKGAFKFFLSKKPLDYDIYLGSIYHGSLNCESIVNDFTGLTFYIINKRFYDRFLSVSEEQHLDRALKKKGKYVVCNPFTVIQHNGFSDNLEINCNYDNFMKGRCFYKANIDLYNMSIKSNN